MPPLVSAAADLLDALRQTWPLLAFVLAVLGGAVGLLAAIYTRLGELNATVRHIAKQLGDYETETAARLGRLEGAVFRLPPQPPTIHHPNTLGALALGVALALGLANSAAAQHRAWNWTDPAPHHAAVVLVKTPPDARGMAQAGTGACVWKDENAAVIVTAGHVLEHRGQFHAHTRLTWIDGTRTAARTLYAAHVPARDLDLAILTTTPPAVAAVTPLATAPPTAGDPLELAGYGGPRIPGTRLRTFRAEAAAGDHAANVTARAAVISGDSGGPIWNAAGELVGTITGGPRATPAGFPAADGSRVEFVHPARACGLAWIRAALARVAPRALPAAFRKTAPPATPPAAGPGPRPYLETAPPLLEVPPDATPAYQPPASPSTDHPTQCYPQPPRVIRGATGPRGPAGPPGPPGPVAEIDLGELARILADQHAEQLRGPAGPPGPPGPVAEIDLGELARILADQHAEQLRGPAGPRGPAADPGDVARNLPPLYVQPQAADGTPYHEPRPVRLGQLLRLQLNPGAPQPLSVAPTDP